MDLVGECISCSSVERVVVEAVDESADELSIRVDDASVVAIVNDVSKAFDIVGDRLVASLA